MMKYYDNLKKAWRVSGHTLTSPAKLNINGKKLVCCVFGEINLLSCLTSCSIRTNSLVGF